MARRISSSFALLALAATVTCRLGAQSPTVTAAKGGQVTLRWLGTAGWEISDGPTIILIDPYVSRIFGPQPPGRTPYARVANDTRPQYGWDDIATPDIAAVDARVSRANYVLVTHTHYDHVLDVPRIALKRTPRSLGPTARKTCCGLTA